MFLILHLHIPIHLNIFSDLVNKGCNGLYNLIVYMFQKHGNMLKLVSDEKKLILLDILDWMILKK